MTGSKKKSKKPAPVPTKADILEFIKDNPDKASKRDIARAFGVTGANRIPLKHMLRDLADEGLIEKRKGRTYLGKGDLPSVTVLEIIDIDADGEIKARPTAFDPELSPPEIFLAPGAGMGRGKSGRALGLGDRALCRLSKNEDGSYEARVMRRLDQETGRILGVFQKWAAMAASFPLSVDLRKNSQCGPKMLSQRLAANWFLPNSYPSKAMAQEQ